MLTANGKVVTAIAVVALVAGALLDYRELIVLGVGFALALAAAVVVLRRRPALHVRRDVNPARVVEGEAAFATVTVTNQGTRRTPPLLADEQFGDDTIAVDLPTLRPGRATSTTYALPTERRGRLPIGPLTVRYADPFRLLSVAQSRGARSMLIVHPRLYRASPLPTGRIREYDGETSATAKRGGVAFHSLREYVAGDDLRLIHWRSSAKTGTLLVKHNVTSNQPQLLVVLDTCAASYDDRDHFDDAVRVAASLVVAGIDARYPTELGLTGGLAATADPSGQGRTALLDLLAGVETTDGDPGLAALVRMAEGRQHVTLGVVTGHPSREHARGVARVRSRFGAVTVVQVGADADRPPLAIAGALVLGCRDAQHFEAVWKQRIGSSPSTAPGSARRAGALGG